MKRGQPRGQRRYLERRQIVYNLKYCPPARHSIPSDELSSLINSITINRMASFGIKHIHQYDLDVSFPVKDDMKALIDAEVSMTKMIILAASINRDQIISCLLRAGADPTLFPMLEDDIELEIQRRVQRYFQSDELPTYFAIYIVKICVAMTLDAIHKPNQCCISCKRDRLCFQFYPCDHSCCRECFWKMVCHSRFQDLSCPLCRELIIPDPRWFISLPAPLPIEISASSESKLISLERYQALPSQFNDSQPEKRPKISALPYSRAVSLFLGSNQMQRLYEFFKAAGLGNLLRLKCLIDVGVDIDARNEYGQAVLHIACWKGYAAMVDLLISMNADVSIRDNAGYLPIQVAQHNQHIVILEALKRVHCDGLDDDSISQKIVSIREDAMNLGAYTCQHLPVHCEHQIVGWNETFTIDSIFPDAFISSLSEIGSSIPVAPREKICHSDRAYLCDMDGEVCLALEEAIYRALTSIYEVSEALVAPSFQVKVYPHMRFLLYRERLGALPPHVDLSRTAEDCVDYYPPIKSTHTFILYLSSCELGGCTVLLHSAKHGLVSENIIAAIQPLRGRLLVFPHQCPHAGQEVESLPKILLRGEVYIDKMATCT
jgi:hypothetical protein